MKKFIWNFDEMLIEVNGNTKKKELLKNIALFIKYNSLFHVWEGIYTVGNNEEKDFIDYQVFRETIDELEIRIDGKKRSVGDLVELEDLIRKVEELGLPILALYRDWIIVNKNGTLVPKIIRKIC